MFILVARLRPWSEWPWKLRSKWLCMDSRWIILAYLNVKTVRYHIINILTKKKTLWIIFNQCTVRTLTFEILFMWSREIGIMSTLTKRDYNGSWSLYYQHIAVHILWLSTLSGYWLPIRTKNSDKPVKQRFIMVEQSSKCLNRRWLR